MARATSKLIASLAAIMAFEVAGAGSAASADGLDRQLTAALHAAGFTGRVEESLPQRLGRPGHPRAAGPRPPALVCKAGGPAFRHTPRRGAFPPPRGGGPP